MPNFNTLHGDEEAIEACSGQFYPAVADHVSPGGEFDLKAVTPKIESIRERLGLKGYTEADINNGFVDAIRTAQDLRKMEQWL